MFNSVESCFNNDFIWFTLSTADRQIGDSPKLLKIQEKYRQQWSDQTQARHQDIDRVKQSGNFESDPKSKDENV